MVYSYDTARSLKFPENLVLFERIVDQKKLRGYEESNFHIPEGPGFGHADILSEHPVYETFFYTLAPGVAVATMRKALEI